MASALNPLRVGNVALDFPVVQAALSGYSDWAMRVIALRLGRLYTLCEVLLDQFLLEASHTRKNQGRLRVSDEEHPVGGQLMGANPDDFGPAALRLVAAGFDVIDINFGCPVKKVLGRCRGGYLLSQVDTALEIVGRVRDAVRRTDSRHCENAPRYRRQCRKPRAVLHDLRRRLRSRCRGDHGSRPNRRAAIHRPQLVGLLARSETTRRRAAPC